MSQHNGVWPGAHSDVRSDDKILIVEAAQRIADVNVNLTPERAHHRIWRAFCLGYPLRMFTIRHRQGDRENDLGDFVRPLQHLHPPEAGTNLLFDDERLTDECQRIDRSPEFVLEVLLTLGRAGKSPVREEYNDAENGLRKLADKDPATLDPHGYLLCRLRVYAAEVALLCDNESWQRPPEWKQLALPVPGLGGEVDRAPLEIGSQGASKPAKRRGPKPQWDWVAVMSTAFANGGPERIGTQEKTEALVAFVQTVAEKLTGKRPGRSMAQKHFYKWLEKTSHATNATDATN